MKNFISKIDRTFKGANYNTKSFVLLLALLSGLQVRAELPPSHGQLESKISAATPNAMLAKLSLEITAQELRETSAGQTPEIRNQKAISQPRAGKSQDKITHQGSTIH